MPGTQIRLDHIREGTPSWQHAVKKAVTACGIRVGTFEQHLEFRPRRERKSVDTLIVWDSARLARHRAYDSAVLVAGDPDLAEAVRLAQHKGRRVIVVHPHCGVVATELRQLADEVMTLSMADLQRMLRILP